MNPRYKYYDDPELQAFEHQLDDYQLLPPESLKSRIEGLGKQKLRQILGNQGLIGVYRASQGSIGIPANPEEDINFGATIIGRTPTLTASGDFGEDNNWSFDSSYQPQDSEGNRNIDLNIGGRFGKERIWRLDANYSQNEKNRNINLNIGRSF